jgi:hypothetical protein
MKAYYTIAELDKLMGINDRQKTGRLLGRLGVLSGGAGRTRVVWVATLKEKAPEVWESVVLLASMAHPG